MRSRPATGGRGVLRFIRRRPRTLAYKLSIPSILGTLFLLLLGGSVGLAFLQVSAQAYTLVAENTRSADATRLQIEVRSVMDTAQAALTRADQESLARLYQQRGRLRAAIDAAGRDLSSLPAVDQDRLGTIRAALEPLDGMAALLERGFQSTAQGIWDRQVYDQMASAVAAAAEYQRSTNSRAHDAAQNTLDSIRAAAVLSAVVIGLALLMLPLIGWWNHGLVVVPLRQVTQAMTRLAGGELAARVDLDQKDELGRLAGSFNDMAAALAILLQSTRGAEPAATGDGSGLLRSAEAAAGRVKRTASELEQAYRIQSALLPPKTQALPGWHVDAARIAATELGGDFYDLLNLPGGRLGLVIGDVSGHGAASALIAAWTQGMLALAAADEPDPAVVLARVNDLLHARLPPRMFVTLSYAVLDPERGVLEYANAGQCYPLIRFLGTPAWDWIELPGMPLGSWAGETYETVRYPLADVQGFVLYSDGIIEARDDAGAFYGFNRLQATCAELLPGPAATGAYPPPDETVADGILQSALAYADSLRPEDDMTVVVVRRTEAPAVGPVYGLSNADNRYLASAVRDLD
jgi:serine phosphatase RsbU (regulator of sigma subunit)/HAMP domain-containing protein